MLDLSDVAIDKIIVHNIGNPSRGEQLVCSGSSFPLTDSDLEKILSMFFLSPFQKKEIEFYNFRHETDVELNEMYHFSGKMFSQDESFDLQSINIAKHLYENSHHPMVKSGELYIVALKNCIFENKSLDAIGIFKSETKDIFLKVYAGGNNCSIEYQDGININKLDKGCLILNTEPEDGYLLAVVDKTNHDESRFWKDQFLKVNPRRDEYFQTKAVLGMARNFCNTVLVESNNISRNTQLSVKDRVVQYFTENDHFANDTFEASALAEPEVIDAFRGFKAQYGQQHKLDTDENFDIAQNAVKKEKKNFRSVIKLDRNFHVYVHGNPNMIEKGFDDVRGKYFYKLFFDEEQ